MHYVAQSTRDLWFLEILEAKEGTYYFSYQDKIYKIVSQKQQDASYCLLFFCPPHPQPFIFRYRITKNGQKILCQMPGGGALSFAVLGLREHQQGLQKNTQEQMDEGRLLMAPMAGRILGWQVEEGQWVEKGQGLVALEAMKMQNTLKAKSPGHIDKLLVKTGMHVQAGDILCAIKRHDLPMHL